MPKVIQCQCCRMQDAGRRTQPWVLYQLPLGLSRAIHQHQHGQPRLSRTYGCAPPDHHTRAVVLLSNTVSACCGLVRPAILKLNKTILWLLDKKWCINGTVVSQSAGGYWMRKGIDSCHSAPSGSYVSPRLGFSSRVSLISPGLPGIRYLLLISGHFCV